MKITTKTTVEQLKSFLGANEKTVKTADKELFDRIAYADKMAKKDASKVTRKDLVDLVKAVIKALGDKVVEPALAQEVPAKETPKAENSIKPTGKKLKKPQVSESVPEKSEKAEKEVEPKKETKADSKKSTKKTPVKKESSVSDLTKVIFKDEIEANGSTYVVSKDIKSMEDLYKAVEDGQDVLLAYHYTDKMLKQFPYFNGILPAPKSFPDDMDLTTCVYVSEEKVVAYSVSIYTEAPYTILPEDFEPTEDGTLFSGMFQFQIYIEKK